MKGGGGEEGKEDGDKEEEKRCGQVLQREGSGYSVERRQRCVVANGAASA